MRWENINGGEMGLERGFYPDKRGGHPLSTRMNTTCRRGEGGVSNLEVAHVVKM
jgi:hypothetical protein